METTDKNYEEKRHEVVLKKITSAKTIKELPNITLSSITKYLVNFIKLDNRHLTAHDLNELVLLIVDEHTLCSNKVKNLFISTLCMHYASHTKEEFKKIYFDLVASNRVDNMFIEIDKRNRKITEFNDSIDYLEHKNILTKIKYSTKIEELPKINYQDLNNLVKKDCQNDVVGSIPMNKLYSLISAIYYKKNKNDIALEVALLCKSYDLDTNKEDLMYDQIIFEILHDKKINYLVSELEEKEKQIRRIYKHDHLDIMEQIYAANSIKELPKNIFPSKLSEYLASNSTIYTNSPRIKASSFNNLTNILLEGHSITSISAKREIANIVKHYPFGDKKEAAELLEATLANLYKIKLYVEEINACYIRQQEFVGDEYEDVNYYAIETSLEPKIGGTHYTLYVNEVSNLDLSSIVPDYKMKSLEAIENEIIKIDPTFRRIGGFILDRKKHFKSSKNFKIYDRLDNPKAIVKHRRKGHLNES